METTNKNIDRLLEMLDHPEACTEQEIRDIMLDDEAREAYRLMVAARQGYRMKQTCEEPDAEAAWQRFSEKHGTQRVKPLHRWMRVAAIFIAAAFLAGLSYAAYHAIPQRQNTEKVGSPNGTEEKLIKIAKDGETFVVMWLRGTWVQNVFLDASVIESRRTGHTPFLRINEVTIKLDGIERDIHQLLDTPASVAKKVEINFKERAINIITTPVPIPAGVKGSVSPELTILLTGTVPKDARQPVTVWRSEGIKDSYDSRDYSYTSWAGQAENIRMHIEDVAFVENHHVRINLCRGVPQKHIDRIKRIMQECGVTNYEFVQQQ